MNSSAQQLAMLGGTAEFGQKQTLIGARMSVFGWFGREKNEAASSDAKTVKVYLNPLHAMLGAAEKKKGSPLTEVEVLHIRDTTVAIDMTPAQAEKFYASLDAQMPIGRLDPARLWEQWQEVRNHVMKQFNS